MRLLCDENLVGLDSLPEGCDLRRVPGRCIDRAMLADVDVLWVRSVTRVDRALLEGTPVRFVGTATAGVDHIDRDYLQRAGIAFAAAPGSNANAVVEYVLAVLASLATPWERLDDGGSLGIVGAGHVGGLLAGVAADLGWDCRICDPRLEQSGAPSPASGGGWSTLDKILRCDVISLHCSLAQAMPWPSHHLLGRRELSGLGADQFLINAARGAVIDNAALLDRLAAGAAPQVVLDVWEQEPSFDTRLLDCLSLRLGTPHIAGYSWDAKWAATRALVRAVFGEDGSGHPIVPAAALQIPQGKAPLRVVQEWFAQSLDLGRDDRALRSLKGLSDSERAAGFDALRRDYPQRRELRGRAAVHAGESQQPYQPAERMRGVMTALGIAGGHGKSEKNNEWPPS
jgi:erythronate-4-phosphate dehydrogenase